MNDNIEATLNEFGERFFSSVLSGYNIPVEYIGDSGVQILFEDQECYQLDRPTIGGVRYIYGDGENRIGNAAICRVMLGMSQCSRMVKDYSIFCYQMSLLTNHVLSSIQNKVGQLGLRQVRANGWHDGNYFKCHEDIAAVEIRFVLEKEESLPLKKREELK